MRYGIFLFLLFLGMRCSTPSDQLFWISDEDHDLLYMAESTEVAVIGADSLKLFLSGRELTALDTNTTYKNFGRIHKTSKFNLHVLLRSNDTYGRNYQFLLRTYTNDWKMIDSFQLAIWNETLDEFCTGSINKKLMITRKCKNHESIHKMLINEEGRILVNAPSNAQ